MNGDVSGRAMMSAERGSIMSVSVIKRSWRERLGRWIAGVPPLVQVTEAARNAVEQYEVTEKKAAANTIDGGMRFRIVPATNGKVIAYTPQADANERVGRSMNGEMFYVVKEGDSLLDSIATCLALDRLKP